MEKANHNHIFWGYLHVSNRILIKRYFQIEDILDAEISPFVKKVYYPFEAKNREEASQMIEQDKVTSKEIIK